MMKKMKLLILIICLVALILVGCNETNEDSPKKIAETFVMEHYTINSKEFEKFDSFSDLQTTIQDLIDVIEENNEVIKPIMTEKAYNVLVVSREDLMFAMYCALNNYTTEITELNLTQIKKEENKVDYNFEVEIKFVSTKDKNLDKTDIVKGDLRLVKENDEWKVSDYRPTEFPKSIVIK